MLNFILAGTLFGVPSQRIGWHLWTAPWASCSWCLLQHDSL